MYVTVKHVQQLLRATHLSLQLLGINIMLILVGIYLVIVHIWFNHFNADIANFNMWDKLFKLEGKQWGETDQVSVMTRNLRYYMNTSLKHNIRGLFLQYKLFKNIMVMGGFLIVLVLLLKKLLGM